MATIKDVAQAAGVSPATVSLVLNNSDKVGKDTFAKVKKAIRELNYTPNMVGRNLRKSQMKTILVAYTTNKDYVFDGIRDAANALGYDVLMYAISADNPFAFLKYLDNGYVSGAIVVNFRYEFEGEPSADYSDRIVQCGFYYEPLGGSLVSVDESKAAYDLTKKLINIGKRRIAYISASRIDGIYSIYETRRRGICEALRSAALPDPKVYIVTSEIRMSIAEAGQTYADLTRRIVSVPEEERPDAVICSNDFMGASFVSTCHYLGVNVPDELAVTGFSNAEYSRLCIPNLTSVDYPLYNMGTESMRILSDMLQQKEVVTKHVFLPHQIIERRSSNHTCIDLFDIGIKNDNEHNHATD